jgi:hypothetical protein
MLEFYVARICQNGHCFSSFLSDSSENNSKFCKNCGAKTISICPNCNTPIRGSVKGITAPYYAPPRHCHECGNPFPWTEAAIKAAKDLAQELELTKEEKTSLTGTIEDLVKDSPQTTVSATKFKKLASKGGSWALGAFKEILVSVVSESAKRILFPGS